MSVAWLRVDGPCREALGVTVLATIHWAQDQATRLHLQPFQLTLNNTQSQANVSMALDTCWENIPPLHMGADIRILKILVKVS